MTDRHQELAAMLRALNLSRMAASFEEVAVRAVRNGRSHETFLYELARLECEHRAQRRMERRVRESGLPLDKTFRTLQLDRFGPVLAQQIERLRRGRFVQEAVNVVAVGRPGTGKSHVAAAVGHELIAQGQDGLLEQYGRPRPTPAGGQTRPASAARTDETRSLRLPDPRRYRLCATRPR